MQSKCTDWQQLHLRLLLCRELMTTERSITELEESDLLQYFSVDPQALPEAFPEHSSLSALDMLPKSGCKGLQVKLTAVPMASAMHCRHVNLPAAHVLTAHAECPDRLHTHLLHMLHEVLITKLEWAHAPLYDHIIREGLRCIAIVAGRNRGNRPEICHVPAHHTVSDRGG